MLTFRFLRLFFKLRNASPTMYLCYPLTSIKHLVVCLETLRVDRALEHEAPKMNKVPKCNYHQMLC